VLGVDIGGSGMKAAVVDVSTGKLTTSRVRIPTPKPAVPESMTPVFKDLVESLEWTGPIGCTFPGVVKSQKTIATAANLDESWIGVNAAKLFAKSLAVSAGRVTMVNDADAAGVAEMQFGAGRKKQQGVVMMITIGTGLGTALFNNGDLVPNTELGHIEIDGADAEIHAAGRALEADEATLAEWALRFDRYLHRIEDLLWPDLFILGGGVSKKFEQFGPLLTTRTPTCPAKLRNNAGIVGAALNVPA
jgi:polyphosphate glucokinase